MIPPVQRPALKRAAIPAAHLIPEDGGGAPLFWHTPSFIQPRARFRVAWGPPVPARRERSSRTDLGPVDGDRPLELAAEEPAEELGHPVLDEGEAVLVAIGLLHQRRPRPAASVMRKDL